MLLHSPLGKPLGPILNEILRHRDAALIAVLPADPGKSVLEEHKIFKELEAAGLEELAQSRRLTSTLKSKQDKHTATQHLLVMMTSNTSKAHAKPKEASEVSGEQGQNPGKQGLE